MMEFLVMPQSTGSLIECYSADGGGTCSGGGTFCTYNGGCYQMTTCDCNGTDFDCPCYELDRCPERFCRTYSVCDVRFSWSAIDSTSTI